MPTTGHLQRRHLHLRQLLANHDTFATTLVTIVIDVYGTEAFQWSPETLRLELEEDFQVQLPGSNIDKLMAAILVLTSDQFHKNLPTFIQVCNVFSGDDFDPEVFDPADAHEMAWGITEALLLDPPEEDEPFTDEIRFYMGARLVEEGILHPPDVLQIAIFDRRQDPLAALADYPDLLAASQAQQQDRATEITAMLKERLKELLAELAALPLSSGNTQGLLEKLRGRG